MTGKQMLSSPGNQPVSHGLVSQVDHLEAISLVLFLRNIPAINLAVAVVSYEDVEALEGFQIFRVYRTDRRDDDKIVFRGIFPFSRCQAASYSR